ncbi:hypothetical protein CRUP_023367 [Coryphaenoides rupestris]|nr:hypothetical protein CRUP_023367 [Coryphaenoides rupestris]
MESEKLSIAHEMQEDATDLRASEEALRSRVVEIIGGVGGPRAPRRSLEEQEEEEEEEEEGDDSVFYDDEDQASRPAVEDDAVRPRVCGGARRRREERRVVESEGVEAPGGPRGGDMDSVAPSTAQMVQRPLEQEHRELQLLGPANQDSKNPSGRLPEDKNTLKTVHQFSSSPRKGDEEEEEEGEEDDEEEEDEAEVSYHQQRRETHAAEPQPATAITAAAAKPAGEEALPRQMSADELRISGENPKEPDQLEQPERNSQGSAGHPQQQQQQQQQSKPGYSTLPLTKKAGLGAASPKQAPSDSEASSTPRYNTLSYRKIQRGNTRQKIKEFEFMVMKL